MRNEANRWIKADRASYRKKVLKSFKGNPKKFYGYMKRMKTVKEKVHQIVNRNGQFTTSDGEAAQVFGEFFSSVFVKEDGDQNSSDKDSLTHSLLRLTSCRVVASSTSNDPGPRSRQHQ